MQELCGCIDHPRQVQLIVIGYVLIGPTCTIEGQRDKMLGRELA